MSVRIRSEHVWEEPFRVFFPLGFCIAVVGVLLWPLFFWQAIAIYPGIMHARLMVEGFMSCFIFGFLGTAGPRVLSARHFSRSEVLRLVALIVAATVAHLLSRHAAGDALFLLALLLFALSLARRFLAREDSPPPNFALVGLGLLNGVVGAALIAWCEMTSRHPDLYRLGSALLNVGFVLLPVLGVAPFFLGRLLDLRAEAEANGRRRFFFALLLGLVIDASLIVELFSANRLIGWVATVTAIVYVLVMTPLRANNFLAGSLRMSLAATLAGLGLVAFLPAYRVSALHVIFIAGFSVAIFSVATRVILGHSDRLDLVSRRRWIFIVAFALLTLAMIARFSADFVATRNQHLTWGALCWTAGAFVWGALVLPFVRRVGEE